MGPIPPPPASALPGGAAQRLHRPTGPRHRPHRPHGGPQSGPETRTGRRFLPPLFRDSRFLKKNARKKCGFYFYRSKISELFVGVQGFIILFILIFYRCLFSHFTFSAPEFTASPANRPPCLKQTHGGANIFFILNIPQFQNLSLCSRFIIPFIIIICRCLFTFFIAPFRPRNPAPREQTDGRRPTGRTAHHRSSGATRRSFSRPSAPPGGPPTASRGTGGGGVSGLQRNHPPGSSHLPPVYRVAYWPPKVEGKMTMRQRSCPAPSI